VNRKFISLLSAIAVISFPAVTSAQTSTAPAKQTVEQRVGPTVAANVAGVRAPAIAASANAAADAHMGAGTNVALMVVGAAAIIIGVAIGHTAGLLVAVFGAAIGLYGLYYFIQ
jgi:ABC-type uncharacterized transport system permease subunit